MGKSDTAEKNTTDEDDSPDYPYLPKGRTFKFVPLSNKWMKVARKVADTESGCSWWQTGSVVVKNTRVIGKAANNRGLFVFPCPRVEQKCKTGEGYDLCEKICKVRGYSHAENQAMKDTLSKGNEPKNADLYLFGHWWCCKRCWDEMIKAEIRNVYLLENAHKVFTRKKRIQLVNHLSSQENNNLTSKDIAWVV